MLSLPDLLQPVADAPPALPAADHIVRPLRGHTDNRANMPAPATRRGRGRELFRRAVVGVAVATALGVGALAWNSTLLGEYSVMDMVDGHSTEAAHSHGHADAGAGPVAGSGEASAGSATSPEVSVTDLAAPADRPADVRVELVARQGTVEVPGGHAVDGYTVNGTSPGPEIRATQGDLVEVEFVNASVADGATLHWHGMDVPNAADGVAGITQDAVPVGGRFTSRFIAPDAGTYWYHSHQVSHAQVVGGLLGAIVIEPREPAADASRAAREVTALLHVYGGQHTLNGRVGDERVEAAPGESVRVRVINIDQGTASVWASAPFTLAATDGHEVNEPRPVTDRRVQIPAGGRADVIVTAPEAGAVRVHVGGARSVVIGDVRSDPAAVPKPADALDPLSYGAAAPLGFDPTAPDRTFD